MGRGWTRRGRADTAPPGGPRPLGSAALATTFTGALIWWSLRQGGYFPADAYGGAIPLLLVLAVAAIAAPLRLRPHGPHGVALLALAALLAWTLISLAWTPAGDIALDDAARLLIYTASALAGLVMVNLLGGRMRGAWVPVLAAGALVCLVVLVVALTADSSLTALDAERTLDFPLGYRNANACFFVLIGLLGLAAAGASRSALGGSLCVWLAVTALALAMLSQSRGSVPAGLIGLTILLLLVPRRGPTLAAAATSLLAVAAIAPLLLAPHAGGQTAAEALGDLRTAAVATLIAGSLAALGFGGLRRLLERRRTRAPRNDAAPGRRAAAAAAAVAIAAIVLLVAGLGSPLPSSLDDSGVNDSRFTYAGGLDRTDFFRVALDAAREDPLRGDGSGGFRTRYALERSSEELPADAHSLPLEVLAELGAPGALLLALGLGGLVVAAWRARRLGPHAAWLTAAGLAVAGAWLTQASIDWIWSFPAVTAPAFFLLGAAAAPGALQLTRTRWPGRAVVAAPLIGATLLFVPLLIADAQLRGALRHFDSDPDLARERLSAAAALNPLSDAPLLVEAKLELAAGRPRVALDRLAEARERQPEEWLNYQLEAEAWSTIDVVRARSALAAVRRRNPRAPQIAELETLIRAYEGGVPPSALPSLGPPRRGG